MTFQLDPEEDFVVGGMKGRWKILKCLANSGRSEPLTDIAQLEVKQQEPSDTSVMLEMREIRSVRLGQKLREYLDLQCFGYVMIILQLHSTVTGKV